MKRYIAHRGNLTGPHPDLENKPAYVQAAIDQGFDVEIDVWYFHGGWWLGHDQPEYAVDEKFLLESRLWLHAKHAGALSALADLALKHRHLNYFYHENDTVTLTSTGHVWTYPTKNPEMTIRTVLVLPEKDRVDQDILEAAGGICSDYIANIRHYLPAADEARRIAANLANAAKPPGLSGLLTSVFSLEHDFRDRILTPTVADAHKDIADRVIEIVAHQSSYDAEDITRETVLGHGGLHLDSLDAVELVMDLEDELEVAIQDEEIEKAKTVGDVIDYCRALHNAQQPCRSI